MMIGDSALENSSGKKLLKLSGVTLGYPGVVVLSNISLMIESGEFVGIIGPNGSGKSTFLKGILGLLKIQAGEIQYTEDTLDLKQARREMGYVPQKSKNDIAFPALVKEVVLMGLYAQIGWFRPIRRKHWAKVYKSLGYVGMSDFAERPIGTLSGGQQQRVMIARALVSNPKLLMLDEPTASVDIAAQEAIFQTLSRLNKERGTTVLLVTHDINEIVHSCDKILLLNRELSFFGKPTEVLTKENLKQVYGDRVYLYDHKRHPHILVGDFND